MDPVSPGMPGGGMPPPASPGQGGPPSGNPPPIGGPMGGPASPGQGGPGDDPHDKIMETLRRIEDKLVQIVAKLGA